MEPALIKAVVRAESDFNAFAVSSAGALGLMQLMPATAADLRLSDPFDPEENIRGNPVPSISARHLQQRFGPIVGRVSCGDGECFETRPHPRLKRHRFM